jgi:hypothetical protein
MQLHEYEIPKADSLTDFNGAYATQSKSLQKALDYALALYIAENGPIKQHVVIILCGDVWAAKFIVMDNTNPTNLVLELPDYSEFRCIPAFFSIWATICSYRLSRTFAAAS